MEVYDAQEITDEFYAKGIRAHPWTTATHDGSQRYVDFKQDPHLIEESLEDFRPFREVLAVKSFYSLLRHINRPGGLLETNDCGCKPVTTDVGSGGFAKWSKFGGRGRVILLFRNWWSNANDDYTLSLYSSAGISIQGYRTNARAVIGLAYCPVGFPTLLGQPSGRSLVAHWWVWGDTVEETWGAFGEVCAALKAAVDTVEAAIRSQVPPLAPDAPGQPFEPPLASAEKQTPLRS